MDSHDRVWARLRAVSILRFKSESRSAGGWTGQGIGIVKVSEPLPNVMFFDEVGHWHSDTAKFRFTNVFRWTRVENRLSLEHLRFGPEKPVFLFEMECGADGQWQSTTPHLCREDHYNATLQIETERLSLVWSVLGPRHDETIAYIYE